MGKWGEAELAQLLSKSAYKPTKYLQTSLGRRLHDFIECGIAHEAKPGANFGLTKKIKQQVLKDAELIKDHAVDGVHWHFFQGAKKELLDFLKEHGIQYTVH